VKRAALSYEKSGTISLEAPLDAVRRCGIPTVITMLAVGILVVAPLRGSGKTFVTICDVMAKPGKYNNQVVALRARIRIDREWSALVSPEPCHKPLRTKGLQWAAAISTISPEYYRSLTGRTVPFDTTEEDRRALEELDRLVLRGGGVVEATFVGMLRTKHRDEYEAMQLPDGRWVPVNGFGNMGGYFAELVIKTVRDIEIVKGENLKELGLQGGK